MSRDGNTKGSMDHRVGIPLSTPRTAVKQLVMASIGVKLSPLLLIALTHFYDQTGALIVLPD